MEVKEKEGSVWVTHLTIADECGRRANGQHKGVKIFVSPQMENGKKFHTLIEEWANGLRELPKHITDHLPKLNKIIQSEQKVGGAKISGIAVGGKPDMVLAGNIVIEAKTGKHYPGNVKQVMVYNSFRKSKAGKLVYFDVIEKRRGQLDFKYRETKPVKKAYSKSQLERLMRRLQEATLPKERVDACKSCPPEIKKKCPLWVGESELANSLVGKRQELEHLALAVKSVTAKHSEELKPFREKATKLQGELDTVLKDVEKLPASNYPAKEFGKIVQVLEKTVHVLREDFEKKFPYKKYPGLYGKPPVKKNEAKKMKGATTEETKKEVRIIEDKDAKKETKA